MTARDPCAEAQRLLQDGLEARVLEPSRPAVDCGPDGPVRATYGASPGGAAHAEPYLYVLPSVPQAAPAGGLWNAEAFRGAIVPMSGFVDAADQRAAAPAFFRERRDALAGA